MGKHGYLLDARIKLDEAITYGTRSEAMRLARKYLKEAVGKKLPSEAEYFRGQVELIKENFVSAIEHFDRAVKLNPYDGASYNDRALCMVELGVIDEAIKYFDRGIEVEPDYATIYHNKGWLLNNIGRHTEAIVYFKKALQLEPGRAVTYDNLADALYNLEDYRGACQAYKKVISLLKPGRCPGIKREIQKKIRALEKGLR